jgi:pimeloyl-ACP methyl ester carboxylesterase
MITDGSVRVGNRAIAYTQVGDPEGPLVLHNHGGPSSRIEAELFDVGATARGLRFVCPDRPGFGRSDPQSDRSFESWARDLVAIADSVDAQRFAVTGWSEGGPWALAAAAYVAPARLAHVASIGGAAYGAFGANWAAEHLSSADALGGRLALHFHPGFRLMYDVLGLTAKHFEASYATSIRKAVGDADREVLADDAVMEPFLRASHECFRHGAGGLVLDATLLYQTWPFDLTQVTRPVHVWHGDADTLVPEVIGRTVAKRTPGGVWHPVAGEGHFIAVSHCDDVLSLVAADLATA